MLGFGLWNIFDVGFFHWVLGIHRVRVDVSNPMVYDLGWLVVLGAVPLEIAGFLLRNDYPGGLDNMAHGAATTLTLLQRYWPPRPSQTPALLSSSLRPVHLLPPLLTPLLKQMRPSYGSTDKAE